MLIKEFKILFAKIKYDPNEIRKFLGLFLMLIGIVGFFYIKNDYVILLMTAFSFGILSPKLFYWLYFLWMIISAFLGVVISNLLLSFLYFFVFTPYGLVYRKFNKNIFQKINNNAETYWEDKNNS